MAQLFSRVTGTLFLVCGLRVYAAETLESTLRAGNIPTLRFAATELAGEIKSYAISKDDPFLLAYCVDDGSFRLKPSLHVIRYSRVSGDLKRADLRDIGALFQGTIPMDCLGSALAIREYRETIYIDTHYNPSAGCVIILSSGLTFKAAMSGWLLGLLGTDYAIVRGSEIHFMSVHPLHIEVFDLKRNRSVEVYPFDQDEMRHQFSRLLAQHLSQKWCIQHNAECDPENFETTIKGQLAVNQTAKVFGFEAEFGTVGFGEAKEKQVRPRNVVYIYRERAGEWEHREFEARQLQSLFNVSSIHELVVEKPSTPFDLAPAR